MSVKMAYVSMGLLIGDFLNEYKDEWEVKQPALIIAREKDMMFAPLLQLVEEESILLKRSEVVFEQLFTPKIEMINAYNKVLGSGIQIADANTLSFS